MNKVHRNKLYCFKGTFLLLVMLTLCFVLYGCKVKPTINEKPEGTNTDTSTTTNTDDESNKDPEVNTKTDVDFDVNQPVIAEEFIIEGIEVGVTTKEEMIELLGEPNEIISEESMVYKYNEFEVWIPEEEGSTVHILSIQESVDVKTPRNIKVGDSFDEVLSKFPIERDFLTDPSNSFYGVAEGYGPANVGSVTSLGENGETNDCTIQITADEKDPFMKILFENGVVVGIVIYAAYW